MSTFNGKKIKVEIFGESHASKIGAYLYGFDSEFAFDEKKLNEFLNRRKASKSVFSTNRIEDDQPIISNRNGVISANILNKNVKSSDYNELFGKPRPSHADLAWHLKDGALDFSGGGRFSGRMTAPLCVVGGILKQYLESVGIKICAYVQKIGEVEGRSYKNGIPTVDEIENSYHNEIPALSSCESMKDTIVKAKEEGDSVGGIIECVVFGLKSGVGDCLFSGLEGKISSLVYTVPAVKGVEFGAGFDIASMRGSKANDQLYYNDGEITFASNNAGGINGGISNGQPLTIRVALRPTPSISAEQSTVDLVSGENVKIKIKGRHDACIVPRAVPCIESAVAIAIYDEL